MELNFRVILSFSFYHTMYYFIDSDMYIFKYFNNWLYHDDNWTIFKYFTFDFQLRDVYFNLNVKRIRSCIFYRIVFDFANIIIVLYTIVWWRRRLMDESRASGCGVVRFDSGLRPITNNICLFYYTKCTYIYIILYNLACWQPFLLAVPSNIYGQFITRNCYTILLLLLPRYIKYYVYA